MGKNSSIGWTDNTFNPWIGCDHTSNPGCKICYATERILPNSHGLRRGELRRTSAQTWRQPLKWQTKLEESGQVETVFNSLTDIFHPAADEWRDDFWELVRKTPNLIWIILTQRISNVPRRLPSDWGRGYNNVWLGISASDQSHTDSRVPPLLDVPAVLHLVSLEPMREKIMLQPAWINDMSPGAKKLRWVIAGGASGSAAHEWPLYPSWIKSLDFQCQYAGIPFFFKQQGGYPDKRDGDKALLDGKLIQQIPDSTAIPLHVRQETLF